MKKRLKKLLPSIATVYLICILVLHALIILECIRPPLLILGLMVVTYRLAGAWIVARLAYSIARCQEKRFGWYFSGVFAACAFLIWL